jgi:type III restriction-modification system methyltransferase
MEPKKQTMTSASHSKFTLDALYAIAPSCFTEVKGDDGQLTRKVDFDALRELLGVAIADADTETYGFQWVGKQEAKRTAAAPTHNTLRPVMADSVNWDTTENLYIEGDNLEVLKLLQRAYLGKVKMIYIDPPYNTGKDFVYNDDFAMSREEMDEAMGNLDEEGNRLRQNLDSNPRYHSDWCSMIYSRLLVARTLLSNDGVIFISIDDHEVHHLREICDEVFGASNFVAELIWKSKSGGANDSRFFATDHEYILVYSKNTDNLSINIDKNATVTTVYNQKDEKGAYSLDRLDKQSIRYSKSLDYEIIGQDGNSYYPKHKDPTHPNATWRWGKETVKERFNELVFKDGNVYTKNYKKDGSIPRSLLIEDRFGRTRTGKTDFTNLFEGAYFSAPKPYKLIYFLSDIVTSPDSLIIDFFSGSATTAHAVMQLNAEDGGNRKYIMVQLPEPTPEGSEARKAGYDTICEIGKERIRRAGKQVVGNLYKELVKHQTKFAKFAIGVDVDKDPALWEHIEDEATRNEAQQAIEEIQQKIDRLDTGFRVLRVDSSNMEDIYFEPAQTTQENLFSESVKADRSELDLLFGCMVDWGVELSYPLRKEKFGGKNLHIVNEGALVACFDKDINADVVTRIAELKPLRIIFREECFATDADKLNIYEKFKQLCGWSDDEVYKRIHVF